MVKAIISRTVSMIRQLLINREDTLGRQLLDKSTKRGRYERRKLATSDIDVVIEKHIQGEETWGDGDIIFPILTTTVDSATDNGSGCDYEIATLSKNKKKLITLVTVGSENP